MHRTFVIKKKCKNGSKIESFLRISEIKKEREIGIFY
jgi:hypothetical protein